MKKKKRFESSQGPHSEKRSVKPLFSKSFSKKKKKSSSLKNSLEARLFHLLSKEPYSFSVLLKKLDISSKEEYVFKKQLSYLEKQGKLIQIRGNRYSIPKSIDLFIGRLQVHATGAAHVLSQKESESDLYIAPENMGTAMHGDLVIARFLRERRSERARKSLRKMKREGEIIEVKERCAQPIVGTFQQNKNFSYVIADDPRFTHNFIIGKNTLSAKSGEKVVVTLDEWENRHTAPQGKLVEVLGSPHDPEVGVLSIIRKHQLPLAFPKEAQQEALRHGNVISEEDLEGREDLRGRSIITIDPDDARDFDDAIEVQESEQGWHVSVHIADVAHYVLPNTPLDKEAQRRGNSTYLVDRVIPMLPESLSNGLCSLRPHEDRLAFSVFATIDYEGRIRHVRFARTVIRSAARFTYKQAFEILQSPPQNELAQRIHTAWNCASVLRRRRFEQGSLDLDMPEVKVWLDQLGNPIKLERIENDISHQLIEELMLLSNELVARHLIRNQQAALYRVHEKPDTEKLEEYRELITSYGVRVGDLSHRNELQKFLHGLKGKAFESALKIGLLKSLKRARYAPEALGHYGLQKKDYTHFTSPIRRYADLVVHRALARQLGLSRKGPSSRDLKGLGEHISTTERVSGDAEKESVRLKKLDYFEAQQDPKKKIRFQAQVIEARNYGLFVELPEAMISGLIPISTIDDDFYLFDALHSRLIGRRKKRVFRAGDQFEVVVDKVDRWKQQIDFKIAKKR